MVINFNEQRRRRNLPLSPIELAEEGEEFLHLDEFYVQALKNYLSNRVPTNRPIAEVLAFTIPATEETDHE